jgi:serine/threonine protein kinase
VTALSDRVVEHLRDVADWPDFAGTRYLLREKIGQGGMGSIYRAEDVELRRDVALKVLSVPVAAEALAERLREEARILARLEHPGVVPVHDVGRLPDGRVYYAMKLVRGSRLDEHARTQAALPPLLRVFERLCEAVAFAHDRGVLHRDLKPQNVMVGAFGEVLVMDWGVAKVRRAQEAPRTAPAGQPAAAEPSATAHGTVLGTPGYMSPEQARGETEEIDERTDVYALGAILYFLLSGRPPLGVDSEAATRTAREHAAAAPEARFAPPRKLRAGIPRPLEAVCLKALAFDRAERYASVRTLAADVARHLDGQPVEAYPETLLERAQRLVRAHQLLIVLVLVYLAVRAALLLLARP